MKPRPTLGWNGHDQVEDKDFTCPHCGALQVVGGETIDLISVKVTVFQCQRCRDIRLSARLVATRGFRERYVDVHQVFYPAQANRLAKQFLYPPSEPLTAYQEACHLYSVHVGAAGAYARRALELLLDNAGYQAKSLADSITKARAEADPDKRLPKRLLMRLDYIKEIGNFALHVRRDNELAIVEISEDEVTACLEAIEDLLTEMYEEPVAEHVRTLELNRKLKAAGKKEIELPPLPAGVELTSDDSVEDKDDEVVSTDVTTLLTAAPRGPAPTAPKAG